jgi:hypothetical protein
MITRSISPAMQTAITENPNRLQAFIELMLDPVVRVHTGLGDRVIEGNTYIGIGELAKIGEVKENAAGSSNRLSLEMKILDQLLLAQAIGIDMAGVEVFVHLVALNDKRKIVAYQMFFYEGEIANKEVVRGNLAKNIPYILKLTVSDWYERWARPPNAARCTDAAQQLLYPGDQFFDQVEIIASAPVSSIPIKASTYNGGGSSGRSGGGAGNQRRLR